MRTLFVSEFISVDGVVQDPGGDSDYRHAGWTSDIEPDPAVYEYKFEELQEVDALLLGRVTYEGFAAAWPGQESTDDSGFAHKFNTMPKYVASTSLRDPEWTNSHLLTGDVPAAVAELKAGEGGPIMVNGSATLVHTLYRHGLVDEYRLMVFPVVLGSGKRLFPDDAPDKQKLELASSRTSATASSCRSCGRSGSRHQATPDPGCRPAGGSTVAPDGDGGLAAPAGWS